MKYLQLLRPKDWAKNLFLYIPLFFSGEIFDTAKILNVFVGFVAFCCIASSIYIINDYKDIEDDKKHPTKCKRPLACGAVSPAHALIIFVLLIIAGFTIAYYTNTRFLILLGLYFVINLGYTFGLKNIPILDIFIIAIGFSLRIRAGGAIAFVDVTIWMNIMVFLLALFMAIGKRRDDVLLKLSSGIDMRKAVKGYTLDFLNTMLALVSAVMIVAYFMFTVSERVIERHHTQRLYLTALFVMAGIMRYLQIIYVHADSGSPTKILYKDRFIQVSILLWMVSFYLLIYAKKIPFL
ncbi:MAG: decaprenyl-phosphate phosphoribosyltransferase [Chitinophagaceae bacterium]|nr:decaprenyl-phosphate phosphoribosyltransferase [Chitinophagaceae bacterium]